MIATLALLVALGGSAYAVNKIGPGQIERGAVRSKHINKNAVKAKHVADEALIGAGVGDGSLSGAEIRDEALTGADVGDGSLSGTDIGNQSLSGTDIGDESLTGADIDESTLTGLLSSDRVLSATVNSDQVASVGNLIFRDPRTGVEARVGTNARLRLVNTSTQDVYVNGVGFYVPNNLYGTSFNIAPGAQAEVVFDATGFTYAHLIIQRRAGAPGAPTLALTCMLRYDNPMPAMSCVGVG